MIVAHGRGDQAMRGGGGWPRSPLSHSASSQVSGHLEEGMTRGRKLLGA
jgi:hypothetical protein